MRGKQGRPVSEAEHAFCSKMWEEQPEEYSQVEQELYDWLKTAPWWELLA